MSDLAIFLVIVLSLLAIGGIAAVKLSGDISEKEREDNEGI